MSRNPKFRQTLFAALAALLQVGSALAASAADATAHQPAATTAGRDSRAASCNVPSPADTVGSELTAINILLEPDATVLARATAENTRLRENFPGGFGLDERHRPHITLLQRYVRTRDLPAVYATVEALTQGRDLSRLELRAAGFAHMPVDALPGVGIAAMVVAPNPGLLELQAALNEAVEPFTQAGGSAAAYVVTTEEPEINDDTLRYVEHYVPDHSGPNYVAHVTVGLARLDFLAARKAEPFAPFTFHPAGIAVYQLGNNGTAQLALMSCKY